MDKDFQATFTKCPCCGSGQRFFEQLANELKDMGLARPEWRMFYDIKQGAVVDNSKSILLPVGVEIPGFGIATDICMDCGCVYAFDLTRLQGKIGAQEPPKRPQQLSRFSTS